MRVIRRLLITMLLFGFIFLSACGNAADKSTAPLENRAKDKNITEEQDTTNDSNTSESVSDAENEDDSASVSGNEDHVDTDDSANEDQNVQGESSESNPVNTKAEYLQKVKDTEKEVEEIRENPADDTTIALKKVEGDVYDIVDGLLNEIYGVLEKQLAEDEMDQLRQKQREWLEYRDQTAKEASLKYEGGTLEQYEYVRVENDLTKERCLELVEKYMK